MSLYRFIDSWKAIYGPGRLCRVLESPSHHISGGMSRAGGSRANALTAKRCWWSRSAGSSRRRTTPTVHRGFMPIWLMPGLSCRSGGLLR